MAAKTGDMVIMSDLKTEAFKALRMAGFTLEHAHDCILWVHADGRVYRANDAACRALDYTREEMHTLTIHDICPRYHAALWSRLWGRIKQQGAFTIENTMTAKDGRRIPVEATVNYLPYEDEEYICCFIRDITERKEADIALRSALAEVEQLKNRLQAENIYLQDEIKISHNFEEIIGNSKSLRAVLHKVAQVAVTDTTVLILGETGTGKELVARAVHNAGARSNRPLVKVNCAALPANLIESELFGHEKGAFTGAIARKMGRFELADGGTIFLDEVGDLPLELQAKLLRILQEGEFERLGDPTPRTVDVRVIAATNRDLDVAITEGRFREDLYYRLHVFPLRIPPLRDRLEDIPMLVQHFIQKFSTRLGKRIDGVAPSVVEKLQAWHWPGNVREMENVIERAGILSPGNVLQLDEPLGPVNTPGIPPTIAPRTLKEIEQSEIQDAMEACRWVIEGPNGAAKRLDLPPSTLRERLKKYGLKKPA
jgi:formate hydrogenlyase transcriptional activator